MITQSTITYTSGLAESLKEAGANLEAIAYTPLSTLVQLAYPTFTNVLEQKIKNSDVKEFANMVVSATKSTDEVSEYTAVKTSMTDDIAEAVKGHVSVARTIVAPAVTSYAENVLGRINSMQVSNPADDFMVRKVYIPEPLLNESLLDDLKIHKHGNIPELRETLHLGDVSDEELVTNLFTGLESVDKAIREWLCTFDNALLRKIWTDFFGTNNPSMDIVYSFSYEDRLNGALALYLYSRKLTNNVNPNANVSPAAYQSKVSALEYFSGPLVCSILKELTQATSVERLILSAVPRNKTVTVYGPVYDKYIQEGGSVEVLLGMLVGNISTFSLQGVRETADKAITEWNRFIAMNNHLNKKNRAALLRSIYTSEYVKQFDEIGEFEKEYHDKNPQAADLSFKKVKDFVEYLTEEQLENINQNSLYIIAKIRFGYTNAYQILSDMEEVMSSNSSIDPREAATIAVINLVTDYVSAQLKLA